MKSHTILFCAALLALTPLVHASEQERIDARIKPVKTQVADHDKRIKALESSVKKDSDDQNKKIALLEKRLEAQEMELKKLRDWGEKKWNVGKEQLEKANKSADGGNRKGNLALWILLPVAAIVLLFAGFFFWPRNRGGQTATAIDPGTRPKCPRCGLEHDPGDTVCKNPACKLQF